MMFERQLDDFVPLLFSQYFGFVTPFCHDDETLTETPEPPTLTLMEALFFSDAPDHQVVRIRWTVLLPAYTADTWYSHCRVLPEIEPLPVVRHAFDVTVP
jgi:hypothetical protein